MNLPELTPERPHMIDGRAVSTPEIVATVMQHAVHDGIDFFPDCPDCRARYGEHGERWGA